MHSKIRFGSLPGWVIWACAAGLFLTACSTPSAAPRPSATPRIVYAQLTPYHTPSAPAAPSMTQPPTPTDPPTATPTPQTHVVQKGEDLGGIAWRYHLSIEALKTANPTVLPRAMSVGTVLIIPSSGTPQPVFATDAPVTSAPTALPVTVEALRCTPSADGGIWCFQMVRNSLNFPVEALSTRIRMIGSDGEAPQERSATLPLDTLAPGAGLPFTVYFTPAQVSALTPPLQFQSLMQSALPSADDQRYIRTQVSDTVVQVAADGRSALVSAAVRLDQHDAEARRVWVAAVGFDAQGSVVATRRWEKPPEALLKTGERMPLQLILYSVAEPIDHVTLLAESRP